MHNIKSFSLATIHAEKEHWEATAFFPLWLLPLRCRRHCHILPWVQGCAAQRGMVRVLHGEKTYSCKLFLINSERDRNFKTWLGFLSENVCCCVTRTRTRSMWAKICGNKIRTKRRDHKTKIQFHNDVDIRTFGMDFFCLRVLVARKSLQALEAIKSGWRMAKAQRKWANKKISLRISFLPWTKRALNKSEFFSGACVCVWSNGKMDGLRYTISQCSRIQSFAHDINGFQPLNRHPLKLWEMQNNHKCMHGKQWMGWLVGCCSFYFSVFHAALSRAASFSWGFYEPKHTHSHQHYQHHI